MIRYSKDVNVYVESKSSMVEKKLPIPQKAAAVYRHPRVAPNLNDPNAREITEKTLDSEFTQARSLMETEILLVYQILNAKGGLTSEEWEHLISSIMKVKYVFPDISLELGTRMSFQIDQKSCEEFLKKILSEHGFRLKIIPSSSGAKLYENESDFLSYLSNELSVNLEFENIERLIDTANYSGTKKRLHYLTIYDLLKYHLDINDVPSQDDFIQTLETCKDRTSANIISVRDFVKKFNGDFWSEYEKYREYKMIEVLARWYGQSNVRVLSGEAYDYFSDCVNEPMFSQALRLLKVHTAFLNPRMSKADTSGTEATYKFQIERLSGDVYACISVGEYDVSFEKASKTIKLSSPTSLKIDNLEYEKTYCVSLWEVVENDAVKLGDLPKVTPGIKWPTVEHVSKNPVNNSLRLSIAVSGGEGNLSYVGCYKKGSTAIDSPKDGIQVQLTSSRSEITADSNSLEYDQEYTFCVYVMFDNGKYSDKLIDDFLFIPKKLTLEKVIRKTVNNAKYKHDGEVYLDFASKKWPKLFGNSVLTIACRTDRFPENPNDSSLGFTINSFNKSDYVNSVFKIKCPNDIIYPRLFISGWIVNAHGNRQLVVNNIIYNIIYRVKKNVIDFKVDSNTGITESSIPVLRVYCFDKKDNIVYNNDRAKVNNNLEIIMTPSGKIHTIVVEAAESADKQIYQFVNFNGLKTGKSKVSIF